MRSRIIMMIIVAALFVFAFCALRSAVESLGESRNRLGESIQAGMGK